MRFEGYTCSQCFKYGWDGVCFELEVESDDEETDGVEFHLCSPECLIAFANANSVMPSSETSSDDSYDPALHNTSEDEWREQPLCEQRVIMMVTLAEMLTGAEYHSHMLIRELGRLQERVQPYGQRINDMLAQLREIDADLSAWRVIDSADDPTE